MTKKWRSLLARKQLIALCLVGSITACVSHTDDSIVIAGSSVTSASLTDAELAAYLDEWQAAKPGIERVTALESDLAFLIAEVVKMSDLNNAPDKYVVAEPEDDVINGGNVIVSTLLSSDLNVTAVAIAPTETVAKSTAEAISQPASAYAVHIASFLKPQSANFGWFVVKREHPQLMDGLTPKLQQINQPGQQLYSLRVGPFSTNTQANNLCLFLKRRNYRCALTSFEGADLNL